MATIVIVDIEGTIGDAAFVREVLFPYARDALPAFVAEHAAEPAVKGHLADAASAAGIDAEDTDAIVSQLQQWIDEDRKETSLKALQGMIWRRGYADGDYTAHLYDDAYQWLSDRHADGVPLYVYSSGSTQAQELYFDHTRFGSIRSWFDGFFDTRIGAKQTVEAYRRIVSRIGCEAETVVFFSDVIAELTAARKAGLATVLIDRDGRCEAPLGHPCFQTFDDIQLEQL